MIKKSVNGRKWIADAIDKLGKFLDRSPILVTVVNENDHSTLLIEGTDVTLDFPYDYDVDPKVWVHNIKEHLIQYYPRVVEKIYEDVELTPTEMAIKIEEGTKPEEITKTEKRLVKLNCWRIDRVLVYKDIFMLRLEGEMDSRNNFKEVEPKMVRYKFNKSSVIFIDKVRSRRFSSPEEMSEEFFNNSTFIDEVKVKNE